VLFETRRFRAIWPVLAVCCAGSALVVMYIVLVYYYPYCNQNLHGEAESPNFSRLRGFLGQDRFQKPR
jgi:hypothetical protein